MPGVGAYYGSPISVGALAGVYRGFQPAASRRRGLKPEYSVNYEAGGRLSEGPHRLEVIGLLQRLLEPDRHLHVLEQL